MTITGEILFLTLDKCKEFRGFRGKKTGLFSREE